MPDTQAISSLIDIARTAGAAIMTVYTHPATAQVENKGDGSPLTAADRAAHDIIEAGLRDIDPQTPQLSEEGAEIPWSTRATWARFWLIDPLDGTKEFINRNDEFTVNIALIEGGKPVFGVVYAPALDRLWWGGPSCAGAWYQAGQDEPRPITVASRDSDQPWQVVASRSHRGPAVDAFVQALGPHECRACGSSLKICAVADGSAHCYPRLGPTCMWDTAAAHAVLAGAGGSLIDCQGQPLNYAREALLNPWFIAVASTPIPANVLHLAHEYETNA